MGSLEIFYIDAFKNYRISINILYSMEKPLRIPIEHKKIHKKN
jgi:hypothetical protein